MRFARIRLYSVAAPLALLPLLNMRLSQVDDWIVGPEGRALISQFLVQILSGVIDAVIVYGVNQVFGIA